MQGAVTSIVPCDSFMASTSSDRFFRLHSTVSPPETEGKLQVDRAEVLGSLYMKSVPTAVAVDHCSRESLMDISKSNEESGEGDPFDAMQDISDDEDNGEKQMRRRRPRSTN